MATPAPAPSIRAQPKEGAQAAIQVAPEDARWQPVLGLNCELAVELPVPDFKISDFLKLQPGLVIDCAWRVGNDLPLRLNGTLIGWTKIEVVSDRLAVRLTEVA